jgi:hypothetical protein
MQAERITTACTIGSISLACFLALDIAGIDLRTGVLVWSSIAPFLVYVALGRLVGAARRRGVAEGEAAAEARASVELGELRSDAFRSATTIVECCDRLSELLATPALDAGRIRQEAEDARQTALNALAGLGRPAAAKAAEARLVSGLDQFGRPLETRASRPGSSIGRLAALARRGRVAVT